MDPNIFREYDIRGIVGSQLTEETVAVIARGIGTYFSINQASRVALAYDARESSPRFAELMTEGLNSCGIDVLLIGSVPTPVLYHTLHTQKVHGGVVITGSHNPPQHNGFKICLGTQALFGAEIKEIGRIAEAGEFSHGRGTVEKADVLADYLSDVLSRISLGPRRLKVVVDAGNGIGGITAVPLYRSLGIEVYELYTDPDPSFPNHQPDPTVADNLQDLITAVREHSADLGIAFDGDADRIGVVDENGRILWGDELLVVFEREVLKEHPGSTVIGEVKCSQTLFDDIAKNGGVPTMSKAGHSIIKAKMRETAAILAGEMSGHIFFADRYYGFDDACYAGARLLEILSRTNTPLSELTADLPQTFSTPELRLECPEDQKFEIVTKVTEHFSAEHDVITIDGARIEFEHGWGLVRASNTQALLVMRFEADSPAHLEDIEEIVGQKLLDLNGMTPLREAVEDARLFGDKVILADALKAFAGALRRLELTRSAALRAYAEAADLFRAADLPLEEAWVLRHIGLIHEYGNRLQLAEEFYDRALALYRKHSTDDLNYANAVRYPAVIKERLGKDPESAVLWEEAYARYSNIDEKGLIEGIAEAAAWLTILSLRKDDLEAAQEWFRRASEASANSTDPDTHKFIVKVRKQLEEQSDARDR